MQGLSVSHFDVAAGNESFKRFVAIVFGGWAHPDVSAAVASFLVGAPISTSFGGFDTGLSVSWKIIFCIAIRSFLHVELADYT